VYKIYYLNFVKILLNTSLFTINGLKHVQFYFIVVYVCTKIVGRFFCSNTFIWRIIRLWNNILRLSLFGFICIMFVNVNTNYSSKLNENDWKYVVKLYDVLFRYYSTKNNLLFTIYIL